MALLGLPVSCPYRPVWDPVPAVGEHPEAILREPGHGPGEIAAPRADSVI